MCWALELIVVLSTPFACSVPASTLKVKNVAPYLKVGNYSDYLHLLCRHNSVCHVTSVEADEFGLPPKNGPAAPTVAPTKANRVQSPARSPDFREWESCRTMPLVCGFSQGSPLSPTPSFWHRSIFTSITLIGSQDLAAKRHPNLFTHSVTDVFVLPPCMSALHRLSDCVAEGYHLIVQELLFDEGSTSTLCQADSLLIRHCTPVSNQCPETSNHSEMRLLLSYVDTMLVMSDAGVNSNIVSCNRCGFIARTPSPEKCYCSNLSILSGRWISVGDGTATFQAVYRSCKCSAVKHLLALTIDTSKLDKTEKEAEAANRRTKNIIINCVSDRHIDYVQDCEMARDMLTALSNIFQRKITISKLLDHFNKFDCLARDLGAMGSKLEQDNIVCHLLLIIPDKYEKVIPVLETMDTDSTLEFVKFSLLDAELKLNHMHASKVNESLFSARFNNKVHKCFECGETGHFITECPTLTKGGNKNFNVNSSSTHGRRRGGRGNYLCYDNGVGLIKEVSFVATVEETVLFTKEKDDVQFVLDSGCTDHLVGVNLKKYILRNKLGAAENLKNYIELNSEFGVNGVCHVRCDNGGRYEDYELYSAYYLMSGDPNTFDEAVKAGDGWQEAVRCELEALKKSHGNHLNYQKESNLLLQNGYSTHNKKWIEKGKTCGLGIARRLSIETEQSIVWSKGAPRCWNERFHKFTTKSRLECSAKNACLYHNKNLHLILFVDYIFLFGTEEEIEKFVSSLQAEFNAKDLGQKLTENVLQKFNMDKCKGIHTPMAHDAVPDSSGEIVNVPLRQLVWCLMYLCMRILWYLSLAKNHGLVFKQHQQENLVSYTGADWAGDKEDRKSISGSAVFYIGNLVSWQSVKQQTVAFSTAEAEYVAAAQTTCEVLHLHGLLQCVSASDSVPVLFCDNQICIPVFEKRIQQFEARSVIVLKTYSLGHASADCRQPIVDKA
ncbi:hypothetical protein PR048_009762 [Dryococelus australis]|uniref:CCHC-type domain-containing protein n=1 Tax=Dryococelus australis TaxID=614101 RepID=A0ABQ9I0W0_9NEOP|nr:hypothetical protein PR048_009762 [Dryococelus australis]